MSTVVRPSGPLPRRVYWVRRLLLLLVAVALVWGVTRLVGSVGSDEQAGADPSPAVQEVEETPTATATPDEEPRLTKRERRRERLRQERQEQRERREANRVRTVNAVLDTPEGACDLTQVSVLPSVPPEQQAGGEVDLSLALSTEQPMTCSLELDADRLLLSITGDDEQVWSSTRCRRAIPEQTVVLRPFWTTTVEVPWTGQRSGGRCSPSADFADPGSYVLQAAVLTGEPAAADFTLLAPPPPPPPPDPKPEDADDTDSPDEDTDSPDEGTDDAPPPDSQTGGAPEPGDEELSEND